MSTGERLFTISIPEPVLKSLQERLSLSLLPDELDDANWDYGSPLSDIRRLVERWQNGYDWRKYEKNMNDTLPMFLGSVEVEGCGVLEVHYVHQRSECADAVPLFFCHGCK